MTDCAHEHIDYQEAEPDVGLRAGAVCEDCGEDVFELVLDRMRQAAEDAAERRAEARRGY